MSVLMQYLSTADVYIDKVVIYYWNMYWLGSYLLLIYVLIKKLSFSNVCIDEVTIYC